jgi:hypothetical protein
MEGAPSMKPVRAQSRPRNEIAWGVVDQGLSSATNLGISILAGRLLGPAGLGVIFLGFSTYLFAAFDLTAYFDVEVGAYGTDHADRNRLVPIALERVERLRGEYHRADEVWVIGDTPGDFACARAAGVRCLLVATGEIPMSELASLDADSALEDLTITEQVVEILTN